MEKSAGLQRRGEVEVEGEGGIVKRRERGRCRGGRGSPTFVWCTAIIQLFL